MRALLPCIALCLILALPGSAVAQSAGDEQYTDPLAGQTPSGQQDGTPTGGQDPAGSTQPVGQEPVQRAQNDGATDEPDSGAGAGSGGGGGGGGGGELPRTGLAAGLLAALGGLFLLSGRGLGRLGRPRRFRRPRYGPSSAPHLHGRYSTSDFNDLLDAMSERR